MSSLSDEELAEELGRLVADEDADAIFALARTELWRGFEVAPQMMFTAFSLLPEERIQEAPQLAIMTSLCAAMTAQSALLGGPQRRRESTGSTAQLAANHLAQLITHRLAGDVRSACDIADFLRERLAQLNHEERGDLGSGSALILIHTGITALLDGDTLQAVSDLRAARSLGMEEQAALIVHDATAKLALVFALRGAVPESEGMAALCPPIPDALQRFTHHTRRIVACLVAVERFDVEAASLLVALDIEDPVNELWPLGLLALGRHALANGAPGQALELITLMRSTRTVPLTGLARDVTVSLTMEAYGRMNQAATAARIYEEEADRRAPLTRLAHCRLQIREGRLAEPEAVLRKALARPETAPLFRDCAGLYLAWIAVLRSGRVQASVAASVYRTVVADRKLRLATEVPFEVHQGVAAALAERERRQLMETLAGLEFEALVATRPTLSRREIEVLGCVGREGSVAAAADTLFVSANTVKTHLSRAYGKLGVHSLEAALAAAGELGL